MSNIFVTEFAEFIEKLHFFIDAMSLARKCRQMVKLRIVSRKLIDFPPSILYILLFADPCYVLF